MYRLWISPLCFLIFYPGLKERSDVFLPKDITQENSYLCIFLGTMLLWVHIAKRNFEIIINSPCREPCSIMLHTDTVHLLTTMFIGPHLISQSSFLVLSGRQTGRLSDSQNAIITLTMAHCSAAPQTPGKLPWLLTFPLGKNYVNGFYMVHTYTQK